MEGKKIDIKKFIPVMSIFIIAVLYGLGIKNYKDNINMLIEQKTTLEKEIQDLKAKKMKEQEIISNFIKIQSALMPEKEIINKAIYYYSPDAISYSDTYLLIEPIKTETKTALTEVSFTKDKIIKTQHLNEEKTANSIIHTLMEVKKCRQIFQSSCVIHQLHPLQLKVYFLQ